MLNHQQDYDLPDLAEISEAIQDLDSRLEELEKVLQLGRFAKDKTQDNRAGEQK